MTLTITITVPAPSFVGPRTLRSVRPLVPVLLAGAEQVVPGLAVVVALVGFLGVRTTVEAGPDEAVPDEADDEPPLLVAA